MKFLRLLSYLSIVGLLITGSMTMKNKFLQFSDHAKYGIVSLELCYSNARQQQILTEWDKPGNYAYVRDYGADVVKGKNVGGIEMTQRQTAADFYFIFFYVLSLILLFKNYTKPFNPSFHVLNTWQFFLLSGLVMLAGLMDIAENIYLLQALELFKGKQQGNALMVFMPAFTKFLLLLSAAVLLVCWISFFKRLTAWGVALSDQLKLVLQISWVFRIVLIVLFVLFGFLYFSDQGQDLVVTINTSMMGTLLFLTAITILACLNWYLPKLYANDQLKPLALIAPAKANAGPASANAGTSIDYARFLGLLTFFIPAIGILKTMQLYHIPYLLDDVPAIVIFAAAIWVAIALLRGNLLVQFYNPTGKFSVKRYVATLLVILVCMVIFYFLKDCYQSPHLSLLSIDLFLLSFAFLITATFRSCIPAIDTIEVAPFIIGAGVIASLFFVAFNFGAVLFQLIAFNRFFTLSVVICAMIAYALIFSFLLILGRRVKIQLTTFLLLLSMLASSMWMSDFHKVYSEKRTFPKPETLTTYVRQWLDSRRTAINSFQEKTGTPYPVFFVNSYGGGIRASVWASLVVTTLDSVLTSRNAVDSADHNFERHVFSYSGASGGTVGFSLLSAIKSRAQAPLKSMNPNQLLSIFKHDYLTANVVGMFGRDVLMSILGANWYLDRARMQEIALERSLHANQMDYGAMLSQVWKKGSTDVPLLFSNTYDINTGKKGIIAPVSLDQDDFPSSLNIRKMMDTFGIDLKLSSAAFLSARFPYVSPTGKFDEKHHFTDGGTLENSGAETSLQVINVFLKVLNEPAYKDLKVLINLLSLSNSVASEDHPVPDKNMYEITAPVLGILKTVESNAVKADEVNRILSIKNGWCYYKLTPDEQKIHGVWPVLPLGWQISDDALAEMHESIKKQQPYIDMILDVFGKRQP